MNHEVEVAWQSNMAFEGTMGDNIIKMDADLSSGGNDNGIRPKPLLLIGLGGCSGMDVVSILKKMKVTPESFSMSISGKLADEHPKIYEEIHLVYKFKGENLPIASLEKAINLSLEKYCGVVAMLEKAAKITHELIIE
ncbi:MAG: OsmC family protein [Bacteroidetes bacterium]|nr:OsmC family protein [Bacteroidota bacterium]